MATVVKGLHAGREMTEARIAFGKTGEDLACQELERRGYAIIARRWRERGGEIDIVARDGETLVFVEVKARVDHEYGGSAEAVTMMKRRKLVRLATNYIARNRWIDRPCRFDVVCVQIEGGQPVVTVYPNAFDAC